MKFHGNSPNTLEISAKRLDVFLCVVFTVSLCLHNPRLQAVPGCLCPLWKRRCVLNSWNITHPVDYSGSKRKRIWKWGLVGGKLGKASISTRLVGTSLLKTPTCAPKVVKRRPIPPTWGRFLLIWPSFSLWLMGFLNDFQRLYFHSSILSLDEGMSSPEKIYMETPPSSSLKVEPGGM